jgi:hypothetical protein
MILKFKPFQGPIQYNFVDPDTGYQYVEQSKKDLISRITNYRSQNKLEPIEFIDEVLENYWCQQPENVGRCVERKMKLGILPMIRGGVAVLKNFMYSSFVSQEEAEKRAAQCAGCKYNVIPENAGVKRWLDMIALNSVGERKTSQYSKLGTCNVCSCPLNMKVFYAGTLEPTKEEIEKYEEVGCWQKELVQIK